MSQVVQEYNPNLPLNTQLSPEQLKTQLTPPENPQVQSPPQMNPAESEIPKPQYPSEVNADITQDNRQPEKYVYNYYTSSTLYSIAFQNSQKCRLAIGTMERSTNNRIEILEMVNNDLASVKSEPLEYPSTKIMWGPTLSKSNLLASSSDCIRLYNFNESDPKLNPVSTLFNKKSKYCGPLTSFDWNRANDSMLGTASLDTTCTIWDLNKTTIRTQLIAHDKEVFDICFSNNEFVFISSGADGSVRLFDIRELDHSTIIYETKDQSPITKIAWNEKNNSFIAALSYEKNIIYIFDSRMTNVNLVELKLHKAPVTGMVWSPNSQTQICSVSEDKNVIISNVQNDSNQSNNVCYGAPHEINNVAWCSTLPEWIGITFKKQVQLLRK